MKKRQNFSECYFEYQIKCVDNGLNLTEEETPQLYFEKNYRREMDYSLFAVYPSWLEPKKSLEYSELKFDKARVILDVCGIENDSLLARANSRQNNKNIVEIDETMLFSADDRNSYRNENYQMHIVEARNDYSGTGQIILSSSKDESKTTTYFFAINFMFKKKISYTIALKGNKVIYSFVGNDIPDGIKVRPLRALKRLPCLAEDMFDDSLPEFELSFEGKKTFEHSMSIPNDSNDYQYYLTFVNSENKLNYENHYLLECVDNKSLPQIKKNYNRPEIEYLCPYCHRPILIGKHSKKRYERGGISCQGNECISIIKAGKPVRKCLYCEDDLDGKRSSFMAGFNRTLPMKYLDHTNFKIVIAGSKRSGKTTFISRLFDITGSEENIEMTMKMVSNGTKNLVKIKPYTIPSVSVGKGKIPELATKPWFKEKVPSGFYNDFSISLGSIKKFPDKTDKDKIDNVQYPFIMQVNDKHYISLYDIAGEDAEQGRDTLRRMAVGKSIGVFCLIDGNKNIDGNDQVLKRLEETFEGVKDTCPIAVILTKFDTLESKFNPNCHCLRGDCSDFESGKYEQSFLEKNIDLASEEIKSYLEKNGFAVSNKLEKFKNVKFFGMSSFAFDDAIYHKAQRGAIKEENYMKFMCSSKRMELPLIWMLKQFGIIL